MSTRIHILGIVICIYILFFPHLSYAAGGGIDPTYPYAWSENIGWLNFNATSSNVQVTDTQLTGSVWSENTGWISLNPSGSTYVHNDGSGNLSGYAWGEGVGYIDFSGVTIDSQGYFHGYASSTNTGRISFNCANTTTCGTSDFKVKTYWQATTQSSGGGSGGGGSGGGGGGFVGTSTPSVLRPLVPKLPNAYASTTAWKVENAARSPYGKACMMVNAYVPPLFTQNLEAGSVSPDVMHLQKFLNTNGYVLAQSGAGSYGQETTRFSALTRTALAKFQRANGTANELGRLGPATRAAIATIAQRSAKTAAKTITCDVAACPKYLTHYIKIGQDNDATDVIKLKQFLTTYEGVRGLATSSVYNLSTFNAVVAFQEKYSSDILGPWTLQKGTGWVYQTTTQHINYLYCKYQYEKLLQ